MIINTLCILGTRPEAIKMAPLIKRLNQNSTFNNRLCITSQHQEMLDSVLDLFQLTVDFDLQVMAKNQSLSQLTNKILDGLAGVFKNYTPDCVLVHGDTTTTLASSLSAYYHKIPVMHVEAGLRTGDINLPWPEEINRKLTDSISKIHFAPTDKARENLLREGYNLNSIFVTGNTVIDALSDVSKSLKENVTLKELMKSQFSYLKSKRKMILVTSHRRENYGEGFKNMCMALKKIALTRPDVDIVFPVHLNPNVQQIVKPLLSGIENIYLTDPIDYLGFVYLMQASYFILTDSGGIQEEAPFLGKPVLVLRDKTERMEALEAGTVLLIGTDKNMIEKNVLDLLNNIGQYQKMSSAQNPYGDGSAAEKIIKIIAKYFSVKYKINTKIDTLIEDD